MLAVEGRSSQNKKCGNAQQFFGQASPLGHRCAVADANWREWHWSRRVGASDTGADVPVAGRPGGRCRSGSPVHPVRGGRNGPLGHADPVHPRRHVRGPLHAGLGRDGKHGPQWSGTNVAANRSGGESRVVGRSNALDSPPPFWLAPGAKKPLTASIRGARRSGIVIESLAGCIAPDWPAWGECSSSRAVRRRGRLRQEPSSRRSSPGDRSLLSP